MLIYFMVFVAGLAIGFGGNVLITKQKTGKAESGAA